MILHIPVKSKQEGQVMVASRVESKSLVPNLSADPLLSTETFDIIHHGDAMHRVEKVEAIFF